MVKLVARPAVQRPDDHIVDTGGLARVQRLQFIEHCQEVGALMQVYEGALTGVGELAHDLGVKLGGLVFGGLALSGD
ncbi:MAG TPA: hypothetical protein VFI09_03525 [Solirubrobacterales bacterium]|nr:hypothetical protein [Solirubrobacterales bacterium]